MRPHHLTIPPPARRVRGKSAGVTHRCAPLCHREKLHEPARLSAARRTGLMAKRRHTLDAATDDEEGRQRMRAA
jgi:hypothetical protein